MNMLAQEGDKPADPARYLFFKYILQDDGLLMLCGPAFDVFGMGVDSGSLPGRRVDKRSIEMDATTEQLARFVDEATTPIFADKIDDVLFVMEKLN